MFSVFGTDGHKIHSAIVIVPFCAIWNPIMQILEKIVRYNFLSFCLCFQNYEKYLNAMICYMFFVPKSHSATLFYSFVCATSLRSFLFLIPLYSIGIWLLRGHVFNDTTAKIYHKWLSSQAVLTPPFCDILELPSNLRGIVLRFGGRFVFSIFDFFIKWLFLYHK